MRRVLLVLICLVALVLVAVNVSPRPFALLVRSQFDRTAWSPPPVSGPIHFELDVEYPSRFRNHRLDVFRPADATGRLPTVLWVHGGGFVGGDKSQVEPWAKAIAANGYTVVSVNYALAPDDTYPAPLLQLIEVHAFLVRNANRFPTVDLERVVLGGDSAGAQIASQFAALQTNPSLARSMKLPAVFPKLLGLIVYCGPYDLSGLYDTKPGFSRFFIRQLGWAYFGVREWRDTPQAAQASTPSSVTPNHPPVLLTDGNTGSFEADARKLEAKLREQGVPTEALYYPAKLGHEYQFDFATPEARTTYERTLAFLARVTRP